MLLAINCGNTNVTFAVYDGENQRGVWRAATEPRRTADEYMVWLKELMALEGIRPMDIDGAIIAIVVPDALFALKGLCRRYFACDPLVIGEDDCRLGIEAKVDHPAEVGADRLVNSVASHSRYQGPLIVVDFGTATTFNVISKDNEFLGGAISPGLFTCAEALFQRAAKLPRVEFVRPRMAIGSSTVEAMQSGLYYGYAGLVDAVIEQMLEGMSPVSRIVATGGLAPLIAEASKYIDAIDETLTLDGLRIVYERVSI